MEGKPERPQSQFQNVPFCPISASPMSGIYALLRQAQILILEILNVWMPVPLYLSGVVNLRRIAFPRSKSWIFDLISNPAASGKHFENGSG